MHFKIMHYVKAIWLWEPIWFHFNSKRNHETAHIRDTTVSEVIASSLWLLTPVQTKHNETEKKHMDTNNTKTRPRKANVLWFPNPEILCTFWAVENKPFLYSEASYGFPILSEENSPQNV